MNNIEKYRNLCTYEPSIPIFSKDWWLDAVCGEDNWDVILVEKGGQIIASFPFYFIRRPFFRAIKMPILTQKLGPFIKYPKSQCKSEKLGYEKKIMYEIIEELPEFDYFLQNFDYSIMNWLPFYWKGFNQTTRYTYVIEDIKYFDEVFKKFDYSKKKNIKRAEKMVEVGFDLSVEDFYENHKMTLLKQGKNINYSVEILKKVYESGYRNNCAKTIYAIDEDGNLHSALFVIWDDISAYNLISTIDPDFRNSGSASLLIRDIIKYVGRFTKRFDFEGSMIEGVENSFRKFGAIQKPYFQITKDNTKFIKKLLMIIARKLKF